MPSVESSVTITQHVDATAAPVEHYDLPTVEVGDKATPPIDGSYGSGGTTKGNSTSTDGTTKADGAPSASKGDDKSACNTCKGKKKKTAAPAASAPDTGAAAAAAGAGVLPAGVSGAAAAILGAASLLPNASSPGAGAASEQVASVLPDHVEPEAVLPRDLAKMSNAELFQLSEAAADHAFAHAELSKEAYEAHNVDLAYNEHKAARQGEFLAQNIANEVSARASKSTVGTSEEAANAARDYIQRSRTTMNTRTMNPVTHRLQVDENAAHDELDAAYASSPQTVAAEMTKNADAAHDYVSGANQKEFLGMSMRPPANGGRPDYPLGPDDPIGGDEPYPGYRLPAPPAHAAG